MCIRTRFWLPPPKCSFHFGSSLTESDFACLIFAWHILHVFNDDDKSWILVTVILKFKTSISLMEIIPFYHITCVFVFYRSQKPASPRAQHEWTFISQPHHADSDSHIWSQRYRRSHTLHQAIWKNIFGGFGGIRENKKDKQQGRNPQGSK